MNEPSESDKIVFLMEAIIGKIRIILTLKIKEQE
jgi:hypothetical protein